MCSENKFWLTIWISLFLTIIFLWLFSSISGINKRDSLLTCAEIKPAIDCRCLISGGDYCYVSEGVDTGTISLIELSHK